MDRNSALINIKSTNTDIERLCKLKLEIFPDLSPETQLDQLILGYEIYKLHTKLIDDARNIEAYYDYGGSKERIMRIGKLLDVVTEYNTEYDIANKPKDPIIAS